MAIRNEIKVEIDGVDYSQYVDLPVSITDKNLEESLNLITLNFSKTPLDKPFSPIQRALIKVESNNAVQDEFKYLLLNDRTRKLGYNNLYNHSLTFIESTHILSTIPVPGKTVTRITGSYEPTLYDALVKAVDEGSNNTDYNLTISDGLKSLLNGIPSPEWTFTSRNLLEIARMILSMAKAIPFVEWVDANSFEIGYRVIPGTITDKLDKYFLKEGTYDPRTYTTSLHSDVSNFLAGEDRPITEPANGWLTPRSPENFTVSADTLEFRTKYPIYKITNTSLMSYVKVRTVEFNEAGTDTIETYTSIPSSIVPPEYFVDHDNFIFERDYWNSLLNKETFLEKGGSFYYEQGTNKIQNLQYRAPTWSQFFNPTQQAWRVILQNYHAGYSDNLDTFIKPEYYTPELKAEIDAYVEANIGKTLDGILSVQYATTSSFENPEIDSADVEPWEFKLRLTYIPLINSQLYSYKETRPEERYRTYRPYNQQANVLSNEILGELHEKILRAGNGDTMNLSLLREDYTETAQTGERVEDYIISTREIEISLYTTKTTYTLSKHFAQLKKYAAILEEYRQYAIPNQNLVRSQRTIHGFAKMNTLQSLPSGQGSDPEFNSLTYTHGEEINLFKMDLYNIALPAVSYNLNNTIILESEFETNSVAGYGIEQTDNADYYKEVPVRYTDADGMIDSYTTLTFGRDFSSFDANISYNLPRYTGEIDTKFFSDWRLVEKDAREQLAFSFQLHHIVENDIVHINSSFTRENGMVGGKGLNHPDMKVAFFDMKPEGIKRLSSPQYMLDTTDVNWDFGSSMIYLSKRANNGAQNSPAWGVVDTSNNEILMWVDEEVAVGEENSMVVMTIHKDY